MLPIFELSIADARVMAAMLACLALGYATRSQIARSYRDLFLNVNVLVDFTRSLIPAFYRLTRCKRVL